MYTIFDVIPKEFVNKSKNFFVIKKIKYTYVADKIKWKDIFMKKFERGEKYIWSSVKHNKNV